MMILTTPQDIFTYRLVALKSALKLETLGMKNSRGSVAQTVRKLLGSKTKDKKKLLLEFTTYLENMKKDS